MSFLAGAQHTTITGGTLIAATPGSNVTVNYRHEIEQGHIKAQSALSAAGAHTAMHDSSARPNAPRCHRNTRVKYLDQFELWMLGEDEEFKEKRLIWLNGGAGAGKSAIMQSIIERVARHGVVLGSFFFFRSDASRNYAEVLIPTLAYQLARAFPEANAVLEPVINRDPLIFRASLRKQAYELLIRPLLHLVDIGVIDSSSPRHNVFVVDGLDECNDPQEQMLIIHVVASILCDYDLPIVFLIASRPEVSISSAFHKEKRLYSMFASISLNADEDAESDIRQFIVDSFLDILENHPHRDHIRMPWPDDFSINHLVKRSSGHFIYAATAMRFIASADEHPSRALEVIEGIVQTRTSSPFAELDALYKHILMSAKYSTQVLRILRHRFLSAFARNPSVAVICRIHDITLEDASLFLSDVQSLVFLCPDSRAELSIKVNHASLRDFLEDESRSQGLYITREEYHATFLARYFELVDEGPRSPTSSFCLQERETQVLMFNLAYAIRYSHDDNLLQSVIDGHSPQDIWKFCKESFALDTTISNSSSDASATVTTILSRYMRAIRDSVANHNNVLYIQQFKMYMQLMLDDLSTLLHREPQYGIIPALMFSSNPSSLAIIPHLLTNFGHQFRISGSYEYYFFSLCRPGDVDPRSFEAIRSSPQSRICWSFDLAMAMKLVLQQLAKHSQKPDWLYPNRHGLLWVQRIKPATRTLLGFLRHLPNPQLSPSSLYQIHAGYIDRRAYKISTSRRECFLLLKAVIFYLHKSACTSEVSKLARKSLPKVALCFPKLMRRARADMDAYVLRWDESLDGILEKAQSLSINDID